jgi:hypothetical protein
MQAENQSLCFREMYILRFKGKMLTLRKVIIYNVMYHNLVSYNYEYVCMPRHQNTGPNSDLKTVNKSFENVIKFKECMELYLHSPYTFMAWCSVKAQEQLYLTGPF